MPALKEKWEKWAGLLKRQQTLQLLSWQQESTLSEVRLYGLISQGRETDLLGKSGLGSYCKY